MKTKLILLCSTLAISSSAFGLGWSDWTKVTEIDTGMASNPVFKLNDPGDAATGCSNTEYIQFPQLYTEENPGGTRTFETLREALLAGKDVKVKTIECSEDNYPEFYTIRIRP
ncbi:hypothetical protein ACJJIF_10020 [Microbulbifer sp. SSSA002]|uniref:hypothetical protein n=1 Tax=Microbulbifer sp. SSSA002 TaxID=3243376 RepID=UPI00403A4C7F